MTMAASQRGGALRFVLPTHRSMFGAVQDPSMVPAWMNGASAPAPDASMARPVSDRALDLVFVRS